MRRPTCFALVLSLVAASCGRTALLAAGPGGAEADAAPDATADAGSAGADTDGSTTTGSRDASTEASVEAGPGSGPPPDPSTAPSYLINPAHTGAIDAPAIAPPLVRAWAVTLGEYVSYPLIVHGRVYVIGQNASTYDGSLVSLEEQTGAEVWRQTDGPSPIALAYDGGRVFTVDFRGTVRAFDAASGARQWSTTIPMPQFVIDAAPTAYRGILYLSGAGYDGTFYAYDEATGNLLWSHFVETDQSAPTASDDGVFVSYACKWVYAFTPGGTSMWVHQGVCGGGGGATSILFGGKLYIRDFNGNMVLDAKTGADAGTFAQDPLTGTPPAFRGNTGYFVSYGKLTALDLASSAVAWSFAGDGKLTSAPVIVNDEVYVASSAGLIYGLNAQTGALDWSDDLATPLRLHEFFPQAVAEMSAAESVLLVPTQGQLVAYMRTSAADAGTTDAGGD